MLEVVATLHTTIFVGIITIIITYTLSFVLNIIALLFNVYDYNPMDFCKPMMGVGGIITTIGALIYLIDVIYTAISYKK